VIVSNASGSGLPDVDGGSEAAEWWETVPTCDECDSRIRSAVRGSADTCYGCARGGAG